MKNKVNLFMSRSLMLMFALVFVVASCKKETVEPIVDDPIVEDPIFDFDFSVSYQSHSDYSGMEGKDLVLDINDSTYDGVAQIELDAYDIVGEEVFQVGNLKVGHTYYIKLIDIDDYNSSTDESYEGWILSQFSIKIKKSQDGSYFIEKFNVYKETDFAKIEFESSTDSNGKKIFKIKILI